MSGLFSFSNPDFNQADKASPSMMGVPSPELRSGNPEQPKMPDDHSGADSEATEPQPGAKLVKSPAEVSEPIAQPVEVEKQIDRRKRRRALISAAVRVRGVDMTTNSAPYEVLTTTNASRIGILFQTSSRDYRRGMELMVTFPYCGTSVSAQAEQMGRVARITEMPDGRLAIAVAFGGGANDYVDASGRKLEADAAHTEPELPADPKKPLVLALDADPAVREMVKTYLSDEGYEVIAVASNGEAREVLKMFTPALVIAEIEGEDMPGYDLCAHIKSTETLKRIPVMLMTGSAYPSDYSSAHSLGAVVCIAKPFRQERFGHVVRLLAPLPHEKEQSAPARAADPTRRHAKCNGSSSGNSQKNGQSENPLPSIRFQMRKWK